MSAYPIKSPRKLIEVALPLDAINAACAREKTIRHGHPSNLHRWWARRPLAAARAVIFAQYVNDPGYQQGGGFKYGRNKKDAAIERKRLFKIIEDLVLWENTSNETVLEAAREEIRRSWREVCELNKDNPRAAELFNPEKLPALHDPFAGGGAIPMEAQRLGLEARASDLNPVAVLINKAMIEVPPKFAGRAPVGPVRREERGARLDLPNVWPGATGLSEDVRRYAAWMRTEAEHRIGHLYPPFEVTASMARQRPDLKTLVGRDLTVIAWLWARTVKSPNPAFSHVDVPLVSSFVLSRRAGKEAYVHPVVDGEHYSFEVKVGAPPAEAKAGTKLARGANFKCLLSNTPIESDYIKAEGRAGRLGARMLAVVAEGTRGRVYLAPTPEMESVAAKAEAAWQSDLPLPEDLRAFWTPPYGLTHYHHLFTPRQALAMATLSDLVLEARSKILHDALGANMSDDGRGLAVGGNGATAYAEGLAVYLALIVSKTADSNNALCPWEPVAQCPRQLYGRQGIPMIWDYAEANPLHDSSGGFLTNVDVSIRSFASFPAMGQTASVQQQDASQSAILPGEVVSTDPPYYDNIGYADLSDFFYIWLRRSLKAILPDLFATISVPKSEELIASPYRHGSKDRAAAFFLEGMTNTMHSFADCAHPAFPTTIYYAFKQSETEHNGTASTGWETFLDAVCRAGFALSGTWPLRTEMTAALKDITNSLASSIVLVCRKRPLDAQTVSRRQFIRDLNTVLPEALDEMTRGSGDERSPVAPVDLSQAIIGPGMAVFSKYAAVLEADGSPMSVRTALQLINRFLAEDDFDPDTQFCLHWFDQYGWGEGRFGEADTLARAKGTSVDGVRDAGVVESGGGIVRIRKWSEYPAEWDPRTDKRIPVWETLHHLIRAMRQEGDSGAGRVLASVKGMTEAAQQLAYRLYTLCERRGWAEDARAYNELITSWTGIEAAAGSIPQVSDGMLPGFEQ